ncbi:MAG: DMT family transporter [Saccharofermentans sp.]|nr:DMT family transporter [Saccharofermentans sp.]
MAAMGFSLMTMFVRFSGDLPVMEKAFFRNAFAAIFSAVTLIRSEEKFKFQKGSIKFIFWRCLFGSVGLFCNFYAIDNLPLADANLLNKLSPFFAIIASAILLKEKPSKVDVISTIVAFIGVIFIVRPTGDVSVFPALMGVAGGFGAGVAYTFVRQLGKLKERTPIIVLCFSLFSCSIATPFIIINYKPMSGMQLFYLVMAGLFASIAQFSITSAYKFAPAREISVFDYTQVIFAAIIGICFFDEIPVALSIIGYVIVLGMAFFRWYWNLKLPVMES